MQKLFAVAVLTIAIAACGNNPSQDKPMYDSTANAPANLGASRDSMAAAAARDSNVQDSAKKSATTGTNSSAGGVPKGTIDSGMTNVGAHKPAGSHKKK